MYPEERLPLRKARDNGKSFNERILYVQLHNERVWHGDGDRPLINRAPETAAAERMVQFPADKAA
jgi:hypothetical protein